MRKQLSEFQRQGELLREEQQRVTELESQLKTNEHELITMREQLKEFQGQGDLLRREQQRVNELQSQSRTKEQELITMREQLSEFQEQGELLREEQQRVNEIEIFHITPARATMVQKSTKYVKYTVCFPMGNFSFICGTHE